jgi:23S rRNA pseudoU1915 N3-methylase RlmH
LIVILSGVGSTGDKEVIEELRKELQELKDHFDIERREIEQAHRLEITDIEERQDQEKGELLNHIEREKVCLKLNVLNLKYIFSI